MFSLPSTSIKSILVCAVLLIGAGVTTAQVAPNQGGTGQDSSGWTGCPTVTAGTWSYATCAVSMVWPTTPGLPNWQSGTAWGTTYFNTPSANLLNSAVSATTSDTYAGGQDSNAGSSTLGGATLRGANNTGSTGAGVAGGALVNGGNNASSTTSSQSGSTEIEPGYSTAGGLQGVAIYGQIYAEGTGSFTQWNLVCSSSAAAHTSSPCGASPTNIIGVMDAHSGSYIEVHTPPSITPVNASASVTLGDTVCAGSTAGQVTDSGGTGPCPSGSGLTIGVVVSVSGAYRFADGSTVTASTTLPLVQLWKVNAVGGGDVVGTLSNNTTGNAATATSATTATNIASGVANDIPYQTGPGATSFITPVDSAVVVTNASGVPSESTSLPSGLTIPGYASSSAATTVNGQTCTLGSSCTVNPPLDKSTNGLANPTADATFTYPATSTTGLTLAGTAPASVSTATGTNATSLFNVNGVTGGASSNSTGTGGVGSSPTIAGGTGGSGTGATGNGGAGGVVTLSGGNGANGAGSNASGGNGGNVTLTPGTGGSKTGSGTAGSGGSVVITTLGSGVLHSSARGALTSSAVVGSDMTSHTVTATQMAAQYSTWSCVDGLAGSAALATSGWPAVGTCYNTSGVNWTITAVRCYSDAADSSVIAVTDGSGNNLLGSGSQACSSSWSSTTGVSLGTTTIASGGFIKWTATPGGTSKILTIEVSGTY